MTVRQWLCTTYPTGPQYFQSMFASSIVTLTTPVTIFDEMCKCRSIRTWHQTMRRCRRPKMFPFNENNSTADCFCLLCPLTYNSRYFSFVGYELPKYVFDCPLLKLLSNGQCQRPRVAHFALRAGPQSCTQLARRGSSGTGLNLVKLTHCPQNCFLFSITWPQHHLLKNHTAITSNLIRYSQ